MLICFAAVLLFGAPYLPTMSKQIDTALKLASLKPGETIIELGAGDGRVMLAAARQGVNVVGYELNPLLFGICWLRTLKYRKNCQIIWGNYFKKSWPRHQAIFIFGLPKLMPKLDKLIMRSKHKPVKLVSFAFEIPGKKMSDQSDGVFMYLYK